MQVGSKNAAFYLGKRIKVATQPSNSQYVHELSISATELEQRYKDGQVCMSFVQLQASMHEHMLINLSKSGCSH